MPAVKAVGMPVVACVNMPGRLTQTCQPGWFCETGLLCECSARVHGHCNRTSVAQALMLSRWDETTLRSRFHPGQICS